MIGLEIFALKLLKAGLKFVHRHLNFGREAAVLHVTKWRGVLND